MQPKSLEEKMRALREREQKMLERAKQLDQLRHETHLSLPDETEATAHHDTQNSVSTPGRPTPAHPRRIMDVYKQGIFYSFRSKSCVDKREQAIQTQPEAQSRRSSLEKHGGFGKFVQKAVLEPKQRSLFLDEGMKEAGRNSKLIQKVAETMNQFGPTIQKRTEIRELDNDERLKLVNSQRFGEYFSEASKFVEKLLGASDAEPDVKGRSADLMISGSTREQNKDLEAELIISKPLLFKNSPVSHLAWSQIIPEIFLSVHADRPEGNVYDRILIWNVNFGHRPEFELYSNAKVQRAIFSPHNSEIVVAGLENGRVCLYDLRAKKDPVLRSPPSPDAHKTPITGLDFIGGRNSANIVSASEEGRVCIWPLNKFDAPKKLDLMVTTSRRSEEEDFDLRAEPLCLATMPGDTGSLYLGCTDNNIYQCTVHSNTGFQNAKPVVQTFSGHASIVNALHINRASSIASQLSGLILSGSMDWSIRLWSPRGGQCLSTFNAHQDPIADVNWNYAHPGMFASASIGGKVLVHNLLKDFDNPVASFTMGSSVLNAKWDSSGRILAITDEVGNVHLKRFGFGFLNYKQQDVKVFDSSITQNK